ncbi:FlgN family protein [Thermoanaerobacterium thermosaccharolyticum DSM 571]|uniref:FlgN family protein n=1 Tax=Thermoanaerobacterium thermosaccharolyticum (strain ATCC 7956 / DSM 571 / NCIMB 9385 / NCA 3814 / NCTC 13789 / WDCM 00135 / 2032) TaxID=580327 RepID=D9TRZ4_THETC|nr:flagellar protein FlgN [Thermoanaerobacterium thermosaccharolyticum]ADL69673.1 FlgN family protein [Thermoanaerobacterium thermosaccharolyticum DSM 571]
MPDINDLFDVLDGEMLLYKDLLDISTKKTDVIIHGKIQELDNMTKVEGSIICRLSKLEEEREKILSGYDDTGEITISELCKMLPEDDSKKLKKIQKEFESLLKALNDRNELNKSLLQQSIEYVNYSIGLISSNLVQDNGIYGDNGSIKQYSSIIDRKA